MNRPSAFFATALLFATTNSPVVPYGEAEGGRGVRSRAQKSAMTESLFVVIVIADFRNYLTDFLNALVWLQFSVFPH